MSDQRDGGIAWTDATWNPIRGCSIVSPGCINCYAATMAARFSGPGQPYEGLAERSRVGARWTGKVRLVEERLEDPLRWRRPRRVFVNSMSDLFHEGLADEAIERVFAVMALAPQHTFQVLTKRAERMKAWFSSRELETRASLVARAAEHIGGVIFDARGSVPENYFLAAGGCPPTAELKKRRPFPGWPLPNVWLGVSVEDQERADARIPALLATPAAVRFVSYEPALGAVDFEPWVSRTWRRVDPVEDEVDLLRPLPRLDWVIVGGESGAGARPFDLAWARQTIAACKAAGVPCFLKQLGRVTVMQPADRGEAGGGETHEVLTREQMHDMTLWDDDLQVREFPGGAR